MFNIRQVLLVCKNYILDTSVLVQDCVLGTKWIVVIFAKYF